MKRMRSVVAAVLLMHAVGCNCGDVDGGKDGGGGGGGASTACVEPTGTGTEHAADIAQDETWTASGSPHRVTANVRVFATVTVEPCAVVLLSENVGLAVGSDLQPGVLVARGEQRTIDGQRVTRGIRFAAADPARPWGSLVVSAAGLIDLEEVTLSDAASPSAEQNGGGTVVAYGESAAAASLRELVRAVNVRVEKSRGYGFNFLRRSGFASGSSGLTVTGSGRTSNPFPIRLEYGSARTIPSPLTLTGNAVDAIEIVAGNDGAPSETIRALGVPYQVTNLIRVAPSQDGAASTLTIEPGVTLRFSEQNGTSGIRVGLSATRQGVLVAAGTPQAPITFTSAKATPAAGDWRNIRFDETPAQGNRLDHTLIEFAGGASGVQGYGCGPAGNDTSLLFFTRPTTPVLTNCVVRNGGGDTGVLLGWRSDETGPDFVSTNTFTNLPSCRVSRWSSANGSCPSAGGAPLCL
jgi:hypothetical protein